MDKFDRLNRETRDYNKYIHYDTQVTGIKYGTSQYWVNYWNNQTHKTNNGQYSSKYY